MSDGALRRIDSRPVPESRDEVRAIVIVRNEMLRLPQSLEHHRAQGVRRFFVIDNGSKDGSIDFALAQPDVHVYVTEGPFRTHKASWRREVLDAHCDGCWTLNVDADELFLHPAADRIDLPRFCSFLDREGVRGIFASMVDMYPEGPIDELKFTHGDRLLDLCAYFDGEGYYVRFPRRSRAQSVPAFRLEGGPRERLFFGAASRSRARQTMGRWLYGVERRSAHPLLRVPGLRVLAKRLAGRFARGRIPDMGKVPLLRWDKGGDVETRCLDALHFVSPPVPLSSCWGALLHFKYLPGFGDRVREATAKRLYGPADEEYERFEAVMGGNPGLTLFGPCSRRFESPQDLLDTGLMRGSAALERFPAA